MAEKKYFMLSKGKVLEKLIDYKFNPGFAVSQKQKNIKNIHEEIKKKEGEELKILEVSSKSLEDIGVELSAFNLKINTKKRKGISVESIFQASKVFEEGGPYVDLLDKTSKDAKKDKRLKESGALKKFIYNNNEWQLEPKTLFYDWIYINSLWINLEERHIDISKIIDIKIFTDVEFNHKKSINCQARSIAIFILLYKKEMLKKCLKNKKIFEEEVKKIYSYSFLNHKKINSKMSQKTLGMPLLNNNLNKNNSNYVKI